MNKNKAFKRLSAFIHPSAFRLHPCFSLRPLCVLCVSAVRSYSLRFLLERQFAAPHLHTSG